MSLARPDTPGAWTHYEPLLLVFCGGSIGTLLRALLAQALPTAAGGFPVATFAANLIGSAVLGALVVITTSIVRDATRARRLRLGLGTGLCGGFTTFSTFMVESDQLLTAAPAVAVGYLLASAVGGILAALAGAGLGLAWVGRTGDTA